MHGTGAHHPGAFGDLLRHGGGAQNGAQQGGGNGVFFHVFTSKQVREHPQTPLDAACRQMQLTCVKTPKSVAQKHHLQRLQVATMSCRAGIAAASSAVAAGAAGAVRNPRRLQISSVAALWFMV